MVTKIGMYSIFFFSLSLPLLVYVFMLLGCFLAAVILPLLFRQTVEHVSFFDPPAIEQSDEMNVFTQTLSKFVVDLASELLEWPAGQSLPMEKPLFSLGLDSLCSVTLQTSVYEKYPFEELAHTTWIFEHPSCAKIVSFVGHLKQQQQQQQEEQEQEEQRQQDGSGNSGSGQQLRKGEEEAVEKGAEERGDSSDIPSHHVAVIGWSCRFPGSTSPSAFWRLLLAGQTAIVNEDRFVIDPSRAKEIYVRKAGLITDDVSCFDAEFFSITPREAKLMDPQQRLLLELTWEALESAFIPPLSLYRSNEEGGAGSGEQGGDFSQDTGVFMGVSHNDYSKLACEADVYFNSKHFLSGTSLGAAAGRISYCFGLQGPSMAVDTACSSGLVAVHLACNALINRDCGLAIAGAASLILSPTYQHAYCNMHMLSDTGRCSTFDVKANGFTRGEGVGILILKPARQAAMDGDVVLATVMGSAVNSDGPSNGFTAPSTKAQERLLRRALHVAKVGTRFVRCCCCCLSSLVVSCSAGMKWISCVLSFFFPVCLWSVSFS